jgi:hypothetical protein
MVEEFIQEYEAVRRDLLTLWTAKQRLLLVALSRFPKSHPLFKAISRLCHNDATYQIRHLCDVAICDAADQYGDDFFRDRLVDGVRIPAVTHWYYGISQLLPEERVKLDRTKQFSDSDLELLSTVERLSRKFIESASALPFLPAKQFAREEKRFEQSFSRAQAQVEKHSPLYAAYLRLQDKVPQSIAGDIVALSGE